MRTIIALAVLAVFVSLGGCSRNNLAYAKPVPSTPLPYPTKASSAKSPTPVGSRGALNGTVEQEAQVKFKAAMVGLAEGSSAGRARILSPRKFEVVRVTPVTSRKAPSVMWQPLLTRRLDVALPERQLSRDAHSEFGRQG